MFTNNHKYSNPISCEKSRTLKVSSRYYSIEISTAAKAFKRDLSRAGYA